MSSIFSFFSFHYEISDSIFNNLKLLSPRYLNVFEEENYRNVDEILEDLRVLSRDEKEIDAKLNEILVKLGFEGVVYERDNCQAENSRGSSEAGLFKQSSRETLKRNHARIQSEKASREVQGQKSRKVA